MSILSKKWEENVLIKQHHPNVQFDGKSFSEKRINYRVLWLEKQRYMGYNCGIHKSVTNFGGNHEKDAYSYRHAERLH